MQKLVKRKMHYETIMPVEAYHPEDDTLEDEINMGILIGSCVWALGSPDPVGDAFCIAGIANYLAHDEPTVELVTGVMEAYGEAELQRLEAEAERAEVVTDVVGDVVGAFVDAMDDHGGGETSPPHPADIPGLTGRVLH